MIIHRYLLREVLTTLLAVVAVLFLIYVSNRFIRYLGQAASGSVSTDFVIYILAFKSLTSLPVLLPLSLYLAILIALGRLYKDSEMTAMAACGVGLGSALRSLMVLAVLYSGGVGFLTFYAAPWAQQQSIQLQKKAEASADFTGVASGRFKESQNGAMVFYSERISQDQRTMEGVFARREVKGAIQVLTAAQAYQSIDNKSGDRFMVFVDGYRYEGTPGERDFKIIRFREHGVRLESPEFEFGETTNLAARSSDQLWRSNKPSDKAEMQWRLAMPMSALVLSLVAVTLSRSDPRQGRFAKLFSAILIYIVYNNLMGVGRSWVEREVVPEWLGLWWVHVLMVGLFAVLWIRQMGWRWTFRHLRRSTA